MVLVLYKKRKTKTLLSKSEEKKKKEGKPYPNLIYKCRTKINGKPNLMIH